MKTFEKDRELKHSFEIFALALWNKYRQPSSDNWSFLVKKKVWPMLEEVVLDLKQTPQGFEVVKAKVVNAGKDKTKFEGSLALMNFDFANKKINYNERVLEGTISCHPDEREVITYTNKGDLNVLYSKKLFYTGFLGKGKVIAADVLGFKRLNTSLKMEEEKAAAKKL